MFNLKFSIVAYDLEERKNKKNRQMFPHLPT